METTLEHRDGFVKTESGAERGRSMVSVTMTNPGIFCPIATCETSYPIP
jgi:hypothetical protein